MGIKSTCHTGKESTEEECGHLIGYHVDTGEGCSVFIGFDSRPGTADAGMFEAVPEEDNGCHDDEKYNVHNQLATGLGINFQSVQKANVTGIVSKDAGHGRNAGEAQCTVGDIQVQCNDPDHFAKAHGGNGQIQTFESNGRNTDN